eukprot:2838052-Lingulodinium_polyedra.AAC.1
MCGPIIGPRVERASVRFASRCARETSIRPRHSAGFRKRRAMTRPNRRFAVAAARKLHVCAFHARTVLNIIFAVRSMA